MFLNWKTSSVLKSLTTCMLLFHVLSPQCMAIPGKEQGHGLHGFYQLEAKVAGGHSTLKFSSLEGKVVVVTNVASM